MSEHEAALAELDRIGREAVSALKEAAHQIMAPMDGPVGATGATGAPVAAGAPGGSGGDGEPLLFDLPLAADGERGPGRAPGRRRRLVLAAAVTAVVAGLVAAQLAQRDSRPRAETTVGAPTAALGDGPGGIYPRDAEHRGYAVASGEGTEVWEQWNLDLPPASTREAFFAALNGKVVGKSAYVGRFRGEAK